MDFSSPWRLDVPSCLIDLPLLISHLGPGKGEDEKPSPSNCKKATRPDQGRAPRSSVRAAEGIRGVTSRARIAAI